MENPSLLHGCNLHAKRYGLSLMKSENGTGYPAARDLCFDGIVQAVSSQDLFAAISLVASSNDALDSFGETDQYPSFVIH